MDIDPVTVLRFRIELVYDNKSRDSEFRKLFVKKLGQSNAQKRYKLNFPEALKYGVTPGTFMRNNKTFLCFNELFQKERIKKLYAFHCYLGILIM